MVAQVQEEQSLKVTLVFSFGPKPKFCSFDLDQFEQYQDSNTTF